MKFLTFSQSGTSGHVGVLRENAEKPYVLELSSSQFSALCRDNGLAEITATMDIITAASETENYLSSLATLIGQADSGAGIGLEDITFEPPLTVPGKIICAGSNYKTHNTQASDKADLLPPARKENYDWPTSFPKFASTLVGHKGDLEYPGDGMQFDYEAELCVVMGKKCKQVKAGDALDYVFGYVIGNDLAVRELQFREMKRGTLTMGKNYDTCCPMGPYLVTADEIPDPQALDIKTWVNDDLRQSDTTGSMVFSSAQLIEYFSRMTLHPGDIIMTGTPGGVGIFAPDPEQVLLHPGDRVVIEITGLGTLENTVR